MAAKVKRGFSHHSSLGKRFFDTTRVQAAGEAQVVTQLGVNDRGAGVQRGVHVQRSGQFVPLHLDVLQRVFGFRAGFADHGHHRFTLPVRTVQGHGVLGGRLDASQVGEGGHPGLAHRGQIMTGVHAQNARHHAGVGAIDLDDACVRHGRTPVHHMGHAGQFDVVNVLTTAFDQALQVGARNGLADVFGASHVTRERCSVRHIGGVGCF